MEGRGREGPKDPFRRIKSIEIMLFLRSDVGRNVMTKYLNQTMFRNIFLIEYLSSGSGK